MTVVFEGTFAKNLTGLAFRLFPYFICQCDFADGLSVSIVQTREEERAHGYEEHPAGQMALGLGCLHLYRGVYRSFGTPFRGDDGMRLFLPIMRPDRFPGFSSLAEIHLLHRYFAFLLFFLVLGTLIFILKKHRDRKDLVHGGWLAFLLITLQALSGAIIVWTGGKLMAELLHTTIISRSLPSFRICACKSAYPGAKKRICPMLRRESGRQAEKNEGGFHLHFFV